MDDTATEAPTPPPVMDLLVNVFEDFRDNFADRFLAGLAFVMVVMPLSIFAIVLIYGVPILGAIPGAIIEDEAIMVVGIVLGFFVGIFAMIALMNAIIMPMYASLMRATVRNIVSDEDIGLGGPFSSITENIGSVLLLSVMLIPLGPVFFALAFALPGIVIHRLSPVDAIKRSVNHFVAEPAWHLGFVGLKFAITLVLSYVPFVGAALMYPFIVRFEVLAYIAAFGDGTEA